MAQKAIFGNKQDEIEATNQLLTNANAHTLSREQRQLQLSIDAKTDFRYAIMKQLHELANSPVYEHNEWVRKIRQQIKDVAEENVSEEEKEKLIDQFIAQPMNRLEGEPEFTREEAWDRIVDNARELQQMDSDIDRLQKQLDNDPNVYDNKKYKDMLIYQRVTALNNS